MIFHDSRSGVYRIPTGAVPCGETIVLRVLAQNIASATLRVWWGDRESYTAMEAVSSDLFACELKTPDEPCVIWYYFIVMDTEGGRWYYGNAADGLGGVGELRTTEPASFQVTVYDRAFRTPAWMRGGAMMQIMVDRFCAYGRPDPSALPIGSYYHRDWSEDPVLVVNDRTGDYCANDFFGGNLKGVESKLDFLAAMGITVLYFNPIFKARSNHKYDTGNYMEIDPTFGNEDDFRSLCAAAKRRGIRVVLDGVFSHTGSDSLYFNRYKTYGEGGAYNDRKSPYYSWYEFKKWPDEYRSWWGFETLPNVNKDNPDYRRFIISGRDSVVAHWLRAGASGWRLDVADELPMDFIRQMREREKQINPDAALIGEVWEDPSNKIAYGKLRSYCLGDTLDATMNYPLREAVLSFMCCRIGAVHLIRTIDSMKENMPKAFFYSQMNLLSSHDRPRALAILAEAGDMEPDRVARHAFTLRPEQYRLGKRRLIAAWRLVCALPGMPCVYYGDDAGLYGMSDPFCRGTYPWGHEDAELQEAFSEALHRRAASPALKTGTLRLVAAGEDVVMVFREIHDGHDAFGAEAADELSVLAVNRAGESRWIEFGRQAVEIPAQSAIWLTDAEADAGE